MNKLEEICQKFSSLKNLLNKSEIDQLCHHPFKSISKEIKRYSKDDTSSMNLELNTKNNPINTHLNKSNSKNDDYFKNLLISLESSKKEPKNNNNDKHIKNNNESPKIEKSRSPSINNGDDSPKILKEKENLETFEKEEYNEIKEKIIPLKEDEEEYIETSSYKNKVNKTWNKTKSNKNISFYIIDKTDKNLNINVKIKEFLNNYDDKISSLSKTITQMKPVDDFYYKSKESLLIKYIVDSNIINMDTIKKIIHLCFNVLSKIFSAFIKETENKINSLYNDIVDIIKMILSFIKLLKTFIKNNGDNVDVTFLKEMKNIGNYCLYVLIIKKYNYEYMSEIENKKENEKKVDFFRHYMKYFKIINKIKPNFKENNLFMKHFMVQPSMISFIDLLEMNRKIINFQLNVNYKM
jgi:hypothetical protein